MTTYPIIAAGTGISERGATPEALAAIEEADVLAGGTRQLARFARVGALTVPLSAPLDAALERIAALWREGRKVTVLADGDPLCFGIGETLLRRLPEDAAKAVRFIPGVSAVQETVARLGRTWRNTPVVSLHGRDDLHPLFAALTRFDAAIVYTDPVNTPGFLASAIRERGGDAFRLHVFENLGGPDERHGAYDLETACDCEFSPLNVVLAERTAPPAVAPRFGLPDGELSRGDGVYTKPAVRATALSALGLGGALSGMTPEPVFWDCGAGTGAVGLEAAAIDPRARVYAMEARDDRLGHLQENIRRTGLLTVVPVPGFMPLSFAGLPDPDRIFFGGGLSGANSGPEILEQAWDRLKPGGVMVTACALLDTLTLARTVLEPLAASFSVTLLSAGTSVPIAASLRLAAENPIFIVRAEKSAKAPS